MGKIELRDTQSNLIRQSEALVEYVFRDLEDTYEHLSNKEAQTQIKRCFDALSILSEKLQNIQSVSNSLRKLEVA